MANVDVDAIVRQVLASMGTAPSSGNGHVPAGMAQVAMLTGERKIEVKQFPIPTPGDDEILVKVEGCGICGTDVHEWKKDPFGLIPVVLGHEGSGEIIAMGKNVKTDTIGKPLKVGDKIVTSVMTCGECDMCLLHPELVNLCDGQGIYGLIQDSEQYHLNGWFASHLLIRPGATVFNVNGMSLDERLLLEPAAVATHAIIRSQKFGILDFDSKVLIQGCGPIGLVVTACCKAAGFNHIIAIDGNESRLALAKEMGAKTTINFKDVPKLEDRIEIVKSLTGNLGADWAFQCTGVPQAASDVYKYIRRGGGLCEMGFFVDNGECSINPHADICKKELIVTGSWDYSHMDYPKTMAFMRQAKEMGIPLQKLITHRFPLSQMNEAMEVNVAQKGVKIAYIAD